MKEATRKKIKSQQGKLAALIAQEKMIHNTLMQLRQHGGLSLTDHAIIRYLERTGQLDLAAVRDALFTDELMNFYKRFGDGTYPVGIGTMAAVIKNATIITILP